MVEGDYSIDFDVMPPSIYQSQRHQNETGTIKKNTTKTGSSKLFAGKTSTPALNGVRQGVMSSSPRMPPSTSVPEPNINLSREELLKLLSVFEGELQARDEVIEILKTERRNNPAIQERYGLSNMPLQALQRDAATLDATTRDHVAEQTKENLQKIIQHQKDSYKKLKQALLAAEEVNQRLAAEVTEEKRKHQDYMLKSDDFVNLLEDERERLKVALEKEKDANERREREAAKKMKANKDELSKLKSLSLVLVEERQQQVAELADHKQQIAELGRKLKEAQIKCKESEEEISAEKDHAMQLENDLEAQSNKFDQSQEDLKTKLEEEQQKNHQHEEKIQSLTQQLKKLKTVQKNLQKTDDQLWRIHEKLEKDEEHDMLLEEVELLRERVKDMEESEKIYTQAQEECKDIRTMLEEELTLTRSLRSQLKTLQNQVKNQKDLQRTIEDTDFRFDELQLKFDFEKKKANDMKEQMQKMKTKMTELEDFERILEECEAKMNKQKEKIILLNGEKKCTDEQVKFLIDKNLQLKNEVKEEKQNVTEITEKLIQESRKVLKLQDDLAQEKQKSSGQMNALKDKLKESESKSKELASVKQSQAEEANDRLRRQVIMLKSRLDMLERENEEKQNEIKQLHVVPVQKQREQQLENPTDLVDMVKQLKSAEERCEQLSEQLHAKSKLCEDYKRQVAQVKQSNNNNSKSKVTAVENTHAQAEVVEASPKRPLSSRISTEKKKDIIPKQSFNAKVTEDRKSAGTILQSLKKEATEEKDKERRKDAVSANKIQASLDQLKPPSNIMDDDNNEGNSTPTSKSTTRSKVEEDKKPDDATIKKMQSGIKSIASKFSANATFSSPSHGSPKNLTSVSKSSTKPSMVPNTPLARFPMSYQGIPVINTSISKAKNNKDNIRNLPASKGSQESVSNSADNNRPAMQTGSVPVVSTKPPTPTSNYLATKTTVLSSTRSLTPMTPSSKLSKPAATQLKTMSITRSPAPTASTAAKPQPAPITRVNEREPVSTVTAPSPTVEMTFTQDVGVMGSRTPTSPTTIKIAKDEKTGSPIIKASTNGTLQPSTSKVTDDTKRVNVTNKDTKVLQQRPPIKRTFQAQKDFAELQKKWGAKIGK